MSQWVKVAAVQDVSESQARVVEANGQRIALSRVESQVYAIQDVCTHDGGPLAEGTFWGEEIECPRHGARFDLATGRAVRMPAIVGIKTYSVAVVEGWICIDVPEVVHEN